MGNLFRVILILILTFIVLVFTLIFFFKPVTSSKSSSHYTETFLNESLQLLLPQEQNIVENSSIQQGYVPQDNGTGFYFVKEKNK